MEVISLLIVVFLFVCRSKELKPKDLEEPPDGYIATGLTGSR